jgi:hypothetical protein
VGPHTQEGVPWPNPIRVLSRRRWRHSRRPRLAVNVGTALPLVVAGAGTEAVVMSAIRKHPLSTLHHPIAVGVHRLGVAGDEQVDRTVHGGPDRPSMPIRSSTTPGGTPAGASRRGEAERPLAFGAMGENLTTQGLLETALWVATACASAMSNLVVKSHAARFKLNAAWAMPTPCAT